MAEHEVCSGVRTKSEAGVYNTAFANLLSLSFSFIFSVTGKTLALCGNGSQAKVQNNMGRKGCAMIGFSPLLGTRLRPEREYALETVGHLCTGHQGKLRSELSRRLLILLTWNLYFLFLT